MKKELTLHNIDLALGESEKNVSNHMHMMDVLSDVTMQDLPNETLKQLAEVMLTEDYDVMQKKVTTYSNSSDSFQRGLSLIAKAAALQTLAVNNVDTAINDGQFGQGVDKVSRIIRHNDAFKSENQDTTSKPFEQEAEALLQRLGYEYQVNSIPFNVSSKKLASSRKLKNQLAIAIVQGDVVKERELEKLLKNDLGIGSTQTTKVDLQPDSPLLSDVY